MPMTAISIPLLTASLIFAFLFGHIEAQKAHKIFVPSVPFVADSVQNLATNVLEEIDPERPHLLCLFDDLALLFPGKSRFQSRVCTIDVSGFLGDVNVDPGEVLFSGATSHQFTDSGNHR